MAHYLGVDYGSARVGVATANSGERAKALTTVAPAELVVLIQREAPQVIVVGLPRNLDGNDTPQTQAVRTFAANVLHPLAPSLVLQDEAGTSSEAEARLKALGRAYARAAIDAEAAAIILQDYLDSL